MTQASESVRDTRRAALLNAASELLATRPTASLAEIADYASIGKATLHRYFPSRDDLMLALGYRALDTVAEAIAGCDLEQGDAVEALYRLGEAMVPLGDRLHYLMSESILDQHPEFLDADRKVDEPVLRVIRRGQSDGSIRGDLPAEWILNLMNYALFATWQSVRDGYVARRDAPRLLFSTLLNGLTTR